MKRRLRESSSIYGTPNGKRLLRLKAQLGAENLIFELFSYLDDAILLSFIEYMEDKIARSGLIFEPTEYDENFRRRARKSIKEASEKEYTIIKTHRGRETEVTGTLEYLKDYFGYTLEKGASWQHERGCKKVNRNPKTISQLITALNNSVYNTQGSCYDQDSYELG